MARIKPQALLQQSKRKKGPSRLSVTTIMLSSLILVLTVFFLYPTYTHWSRRLSIRMQKEDSGHEEHNAFEELKKSELPTYAILETTKGSITVKLFKDSSPKVVDKFIELCQTRHFKGMLFHHVIKNYVIQAGATSNTGAAEEWAVKGKHNSQLDTSLKHEAFMLGISKEKQDNGGFELFITTAPIPDQNEKLIVFGRVIKGKDVVQEIEEVDTDEHYQPKSPISILDVNLERDI